MSKRVKGHWVVEGPMYSDGWYVVTNRLEEYPSLTERWFKVRTHARQYRRAMQDSRFREARQLLRCGVCAREDVRELEPSSGKPHE